MDYDQNRRGLAVKGAFTGVLLLVLIVLLGMSWVFRSSKPELALAKDLWELSLVAVVLAVGLTSIWVT